MSDLGPYQAPRPVWVRVPAVGRQGEDMAHTGFLLEWRRTVEWGLPAWEALVELDGRDPYWTTSSNVRPR